MLLILEPECNGVVLMSIVITKVGENLFDAKVNLSQETGDIYWQTAQPLPAKVLVDQLLLLGKHQTDIGDAFYEADPDWVEYTK